MPFGPRVLGLDPGSHHTGYAVVEPGNRPNDFRLLAAGTIHAPAKKPLNTRLLAIFEKLNQVIGRTSPVEMAVEGIFTYKNARTALILGHARGVALLASSLAGLEVFEYTPTSVKKALVGNGRATKEQVRAMTMQILGKPLDLGLDATDALALAITHLNTRKINAMLERCK